MLQKSYRTFFRILERQLLDPSKPSSALKALMMAEYFMKRNSMDQTTVLAKAYASAFQRYLSDVGTSVEQAAETLIQIHGLFPNPESCKSFLLDTYPYLLKNPYIFETFSDNALQLYNLLYFFLSASDSCPREKLTDAEHYIDRYYIPNEDTLSQLGVTDLDIFINCWHSLSCYYFRAAPLYVPDKLNAAMKVYKQHKIPYHILLEQYVGLVNDKDIAKAFNPWSAWRQSTNLPYIESGTTLEETLYNTAVTKLCKLRPVDVVNALFFRDRSDSLVERNILLNTIQFEIGNAKNILVVNPSPDFLIAYSQLDIANKQTVFAVTDDIVASAYTIEYRNLHRSFSFFPFSKLHTLSAVFNYLVVMARDSSLSSYSSAFSLCREDAHIIAFLPQTMITGKDESIIDVFSAHKISVDRILSLPNQLSRSGKRKKMILHAQKHNVSPTFFELLSTSYECLGGIDHYTTIVPTVCLIPYEMLYKKRTLKQMQDYWANTLLGNTDKTPKRKNGAAHIYAFSQEIMLHYHLYKEANGSFSARACFRALIPEGESRLYGKRLTEYIEGGLRGSTEQITTKLGALVLDQKYEEIIASEIERFYCEHPETLTLKTVWYCNRKALRISDLTYDDRLAIELFCGETQSLSNLVIGSATKESIEEALAQTVPPGCDSDPKYLRLLELIFRTAVSRNYLASNPLSVQKTSLSRETDRAMRALRAALSKNSLSFREIRQIMDYLLEPVDEFQTPRAVKHSIWLIPLIRLCTGMPLREICALQWKHFHQIGTHDAWRLNIVQQFNNSGEIIPIAVYRFIRQHRFFPCVSILSNMLQQRSAYIQKEYQFAPQELASHPIVLNEEPVPKRGGRRKSVPYCTIHQARQVCKDALSQAGISSDVITLLDGDDAFQEDLNACRNDLYYANFLHYANHHCGLSEGEVCYIVGRKGPDTFSEHYVDYRNDYIQLDMIQRLNRLWDVIYCGKRIPMRNKYTACEQNADHTITAFPMDGGMASLDIAITPLSNVGEGDVRIRIESDHGVNGTIAVFGKEESTE